MITQRERTLRLGIAVLLTAGVLATCVYHSWSPLGGHRSPATILRRGNGAEPESLDPHHARSESALTILRDLFEGLTALGDDGEPVAAAAERIDVSADAKTYTFHLRSSARWSNGERVVAEDFAAAWRGLVDPRTGAEYANILSPLRGAVDIELGRAPPATLGVRVVDDATLVAQLTEPTPYFLQILAHPATFPLNRPSLVQYGRAFAKPGVLVSNGPFVLLRWDFGSHLVAGRNAHYWDDGSTRLDGVEYYSFADAAAELGAFRTGQIDVTSTIPAAQTAWIKSHMGTALHVAPQLAVYYLGFNLRKPPLGPLAGPSRALRQALAMVIDRERLVTDVTAGGETAAYTLVPAQTRDYAAVKPAYAEWPMAQRIKYARGLLSQAGLTAHLPPLELRYNNGELHSRIAIAVAAMWQQALGINVTLRAEEFKALLQDIDRGDASIFRASWIADYDDAYSFLQVLQSGFGINMTRYASNAYDDLLMRAAHDPDGTQRRATLQQAEAEMLQDQPLIPLYFYVSKHLVAAPVLGWRNNVMNVVYSKNLKKVEMAGVN